LLSITLAPSLIAQALAENLPFVSNESIFDSYAVRRVW